MGLLRIFGIGFVYMVALVGWMILGGVTQGRASSQAERLGDAVANLWGVPQQQSAPALAFFPVGAVAEKMRVTVTAEAGQVNMDGEILDVQVAADGSRYVMKSKPPVGEPMSLGASALDVSLHSDARQKGLVWYALYDVAFKGAYTYEHRDARPGHVRVRLPLPSSSALYDRLSFEVNGEDRRDALNPQAGLFDLQIPVKQGDKVSFALGYVSRGIGNWSYRPAEGVQRLENFELAMKTDFADVDFPADTLSPSTRARVGSGWDLRWNFKTTVTGQGIGMTMPAHIQPGELAAALSFSAPVSLFFFFLVLFVLAALRGLNIHPVNYLFISGAFFSFHLLFAYSVDHVSVPVAFAICSVVSMVLVVSYLRLVVSARFAFVEVALAQFVYLIVFSLAHFWEGFTGLTITVLAILTLFVLMQATGRVDWSRVLRKPERPEMAPPLASSALE
ncbi:MAG TPA: inner membrane CreD family protein [Polyangiaceae bacterium]|nr:inner membrane CreD family protein [Polyangiaceae bacterium]